MLKRKKHSTKGAPKILKTKAKCIPFFAKKDIQIGNEFFLPYGSAYAGYQNNILFKRKDIIERADQIYFRECNVDRYKPVLDAMVSQE